VTHRDSVEAAAATLVNAMDRWSWSTNLGVVRRHYQRLSELLKADRDSTDPPTVASVDESLSYNAAHAVLFTCANLEEMLWFLWRTVGRDGGPDRRGGLDRFKPALGPGGLGIDLGSAAWWEPLRDAFTVRDCLLHGNGRLGLLTPRKRAALDRTLERAGKDLSVNHDRVKVSDRYVRKTLGFAMAMVDAIHAARERLAEESDAAEEVSG
jgi:hypothetical protein